MALKMFVSEVENQNISIETLCNKYIIQMNDLKKHITDFTSNESLEGEAYESAKEYFESVYVTLANGIVLACETMISTSQGFLSKYNFFVDDNDIDEDEVSGQINSLSMMVQELRTVGQMSGLDSYVDTLNGMKRSLEIKMEKLYQYNTISSKIFEELEILLTDIKKGLDQIKNGVVFDSNTKTFSTSTLDMSWAENINNNVYSKMSEEEKFAYHLKNEFGFGDEEIAIMIKIRTNLKENYPNLSQAKRDHLYNLIIGTFYYGTNGIIDSFKWTNTAGITGDYVDKWGLDSGNELENIALEVFIKNNLKITDKEYNLLRYKVRIQHFISSGSSEFKWENAKNDLDCRKKLEESLGRTLTDKEFEKIWKSQYDQMNNKGDYAHQSITTATILNSNNFRLANLMGGHENVNNLAGWKGDATIPGKDDKISFGPDDYKSDLDAENITYLMKRDSLSFTSASNKYYQEVGNKYTRAELFLQHTPIEVVKQSIYVYKDYAHVISSSRFEVVSFNPINTMEKLKIKAPDAYNFIKNLENNNNEMQDYKK